MSTVHKNKHVKCRGLQPLWINGYYFMVRIEQHMNGIKVDLINIWSYLNHTGVTFALTSYCFSWYDFILMYKQQTQQQYPTTKHYAVHWFCKWTAVQKNNKTVEKVINILFVSLNNVSDCAEVLQAALYLKQLRTFSFCRKASKRCVAVYSSWKYKWEDLTPSVPLVSEVCCLIWTSSGFKNISQQHKFNGF